MKKKYPRLVWEFADQSEQAELVVRTDADWAGCRRSRKSKSGGMVSIGNHCIKVLSKTQAVVAKSSAESELYGVVKGPCEALGVCTLRKDIGWDLDMRLELDATAAKGILDRIDRGFPRSDTSMSIAYGSKSRQPRRVKIPGEINTADKTSATQ